MNTQLPVSCCSCPSQQNIHTLSKFIAIFLLFFTLILRQTAAAQISAVNSGDWSDAATWSGGVVPTTGNDVFISGNYTVTVTAPGAVCSNLQLGIGDETQNGEIAFSGTSSLTVSNGIILGDIDGASGIITMGANATLTCGTVSEGYPGFSGVFDTNNGTIVFTGLCILPLNFTEFNNLVINSSTTSLVYSNININGNLTINTGGTFFLTAFTADRVSPGGTLTVANGGVIRLAGNITLPANFSTHSIGATSTIDYRGTSAQNIAPLNSSQKYGNLTVQNSVKTLAGSIAVAGTLTFAGSNTKLAIGNNTLTIEGAITGSLTSNRNFSCAGSSNLTLKGTLNRTLFFDQSVPGTTNAISNLTINHATYTTTMGNAFTVKGVLTFTAGKLAIAGNTLTLSGTVTNTVTEGLTGSATSNLVFSNTAANASLSMDQTTNETTNRLNNLTISSSTRTLTLTNALKLSGTVQPTSGIIASAGNLTLLSSAARTANVAAGAAGGGYITGDVVVERYISSGRKWQLLSVPTTGSQTIHDAWQEGTVAGSSGSTGYGTWITTNVAADAGNGFDYVTPGTSIKTYNPSTADFTTAPSTLAVLASTNAYMIFTRGDRGCTSFNTNVSTTILRSTGVLRQGTQTAMNVPAGKNIAVANAYPSPVDFRLLTKSAAVDDLFYVWDPKLGGALGLGAYQTFTLSGGNYVVTPGGGSYGSGGSISNAIQPGQGFLVHATGSTGTLQFVETAKSATNQLVSRPLGGAVPQLRINLYGGSPDKIVDGVLVEMSESFSAAADREDAIKNSNLNETFSIANSHANFSVERRPPPHAADTIFFNSYGFRTQDYLLEIVPGMMETFSLDAYLEDTYLGFKYPLSMSDTNRIAFKTTTDPASKAVSRFRIVLKPAVVLPITFTAVYAVQKDDAVSIEWQTTNEINVKNYVVEKSTDGRFFEAIDSIPSDSQNTSSAFYSLLDKKPFAGKNFYRIKGIDINKAEKFSHIVMVNFNRPGYIKVFPNPVLGKQVNIYLEGMKNGSGNFSVFSATGNTITTGVFEVSGNSQQMQIALPAAITPGKYQLRINVDELTQITSLIVL